VPELKSYDDPGNRQRIAQLAARGVDVWGPERVYIAADVPLENIEAGASIVHATLRGAQLRVGRGARIGGSGHAEVTDCQIGRDVEIGAGYYEGATLLDGSRVRGFAELRPGTLLEEQAEAAHSVAFKNTILTATVVTGSLINYCDAFMSGGTSRDDHSEVGSGVIHFNFDPRGDKYGSLIGDVRGVLLRSAPIFVGGQCGLVAPLHIDFGATVAAGSMVRRDVPANCVHFEAAGSARIENFDREVYAGVERKFLATARLIGTLRSFHAWYEAVRIPFADDFERVLYRAAQGQAQSHISERIKRLSKIIGKLDRSLSKTSGSGDAKLLSYHAEHRLLLKRRKEIEQALSSAPDAPPPPKAFLQEYEKTRKSAGYLDAVRGVSAEAAEAAAAWLNAMADDPVNRLAKLFA
jgi:UDP-N-acetylglucosamine/UDP-N-acetylgalactosamine diphosphorylase